MFIYSVPYYDQKEELVRNRTFFSKEPYTVIALLKEFFGEMYYSYLDEDYNTYSEQKVLTIAVEHYKIDTISIQELKNDVIYDGMFYVKQLYRSLLHLDFCINEINNQKEIILSSHIAYKNEVTEDDIHFLVNGKELFLFDFYTKETEEINHVLLEEELTIMKYVEPGIDVLDCIEIEKPLKSKEEIIGVFVQWAKKLGVNLTGKKIRMAEEIDFTSRPLFDQLKKQKEEDSERQFVIPSNLFFLSKEDVPPITELIDLLKNETPQTIACVLDEFSDQYIMNVLSFLPEKKEEIIHSFLQIPSTTLNERIRFVSLFFNEFNLETVKKRIQYLQELECVKNPIEDDPYSQYLEFLALQSVLEKK